MNDDQGYTNSEEERPVLNRKVLREDIKEYLIDAILRRKYLPGDRLVEMRLAKKLGVSQAPIREALRDLELMGFVESEPYRGTRVREIKPDEMRDVYTVRAALEALAGRLVAPKVTDELLQNLEVLAEQMMDDARNGRSHDFVKNNFTFHRKIIEATGNQLLVRLLDSMQFSYWTFVSTVISGHDLTYLAGRHYKVLEALRTRDPEAASAALQTHIEELRDTLNVPPDGRAESDSGQA